ncbi:hypothetical protein F7725_007708 [Dissostichus mawsoni]|uniref:Uncharacterized protein n=1 Tax=Dissostichus mawsoni TaxID=36200 RepID=A0A7J5Y547_DISMA|nr:hypothetical protein F7725_007708 [Dissostichus mawsoni]
METGEMAWSEEAELPSASLLRPQQTQLTEGGALQPFASPNGRGRGEDFAGLVDVAQHPLQMSVAAPQHHVIFTLSEQREVLQQQARLTGGSREHRVYRQPEKRQETEEKAELELWAGWDTMLPSCTALSVLRHFPYAEFTFDTEKLLKLYTDQLLPFFGQSRGLPELLADPEPLQLQSDAAVVGRYSALCDAQLFLQQRSVGGLPMFHRFAALLLRLSSKHCCTQLILGRENRRCRMKN